MYFPRATCPWFSLDNLSQGYSYNSNKKLIKAFNIFMCKEREKSQGNL